MPIANTEAMRTKHLDGIAQTVETGQHAVVVTVIVRLGISTELNPVEQLWQQLRDKHWANRCFKDDDDIVYSCCKA